MKLRGLVTICALIWAASAAQTVYAQNTSRFFVNGPTARDVCRTHNNDQSCYNTANRYIANNTDGSVFHHGNPYSAANCASSGDYFLGVSGKECINKSQCPAEFDPETGEHCITGGSYDEFGYDATGYDSGNCTLDNVCPDDEGWRDSEGYDIGGFDDNGEDRGGNTIQQGGGYGGSAGTGGTPPTGWTPPEDPDYQNGENQADNGLWLCHNAYPVTVSKSLVPGAVLDGLAGCANGCQYQPSGTYYDFDYNQEVVALVPNSQPCNGSEPTISNLEISTYVEPDTPQEPDSHFNHCFVQNARFYCQSPDMDAPVCYNQRTDGSIGLATSCGANQNEPDQLCGSLNGVYQCFPPNQRCESYSGNIVCVNPNGSVVPQDDPDHVINGGNSDGNSNNDVFADPTDVQNNGQSTQDRVVNQLNSRELARQISRDLQPEFDRIVDTLNAPVSMPDGQTTATQAVAGISDGLQAVSDPASALSYDGDGIFGPISEFTGFMPTGGGCSNFDYSIFPEYGMVLSIDTCLLSDIRLVMEFILYGLTVFALYYMITGNREKT